MKLIDTHCHLTDGRLRSQLAGVLARAADAKVAAIITVGSDLADSAAAAVLARQYEQVFFAAGVHPHEAKDVGGDYLDALTELARHPKNVAIGEIGLDYHYDLSPRKIQQRVFAEQLALAKAAGKAAIIHTREAFDDTLAVVDESGIDASAVVFHSFTGDATDARRVLDMGAAVSFSGIVTFKKAAALRESAALVGDDRLLIETDAPYLSPEPVRKAKTNEPANVAHVAACLAQVRRTSLERIAELTAANAARLFGVDTPGGRRRLAIE